MTITIAVDAMSGDFGIDVTVPATIIISQKHPKIKFILVGRKELIEKKILDFFNNNKTLNYTNTAVIDHRIQQLYQTISIIHANEIISMDEEPIKAMRFKRNSSMHIAMNLVKKKIANACVSAGNTGALVAIAHYIIKTLPNIDRPAIVAALPTLDPHKEVRVLDLGANIEVSEHNLHQFAIMGSILIRTICNIPNPTIGLLNIGEENIKGNKQVKKAAQLLSHDKTLNYIGFIEGNEIFSGKVDLVICNGFVGNITLKTMEGLTKLIIYYLKKEFTKNIFSKIVALISRNILKKVAAKLDTNKKNGASLIGLNNIVIKSHGSANIAAFINAIEETIKETHYNIPEKIQNEISH